MQTPLVLNTISVQCECKASFETIFSPLQICKFLLILSLCSHTLFCLVFDLPLSNNVKYLQCQQKQRKMNIRGIEVTCDSLLPFLYLIPL